MSRMTFSVCKRYVCVRNYYASAFCTWRMPKFMSKCSPEKLHIIEQLKSYYIESNFIEHHFVDMMLISLVHSCVFTTCAVCLFVVCLFACVCVCVPQMNFFSALKLLHSPSSIPRGFIYRSFVLALFSISFLLARVKMMQSAPSVFKR